MGEEAGAPTDSDNPQLFPLRGIVPKRAVLTELARGFLLVHDSDPRQARQFAASFLRERAGTPSPPRIVAPRGLPSIRRSVSETLREGT